MKLPKTLENITLLLFIAIAFLFYAYLPTHNSTVDAYYYASCIKYGKDLFLPHHLLYNWLGYLLYNFSVYFDRSIDALALMKLTNALFTSGCLYVFYLILKRLNYSFSEILPTVLIAGFSFGIWRFATENENYIIPVFFSLIGSLLFINFLKKQIILTLFFSGFMASLACLFHQIHFFWWFGLFLGVIFITKNFKQVLLYTLPALIVPLVYLIVIEFYCKLPITYFNTTHFVFHDFYSGGVTTAIGLDNFYMTGISFIRTFFQVHGIQIILIKKSLFFLLPILIFIGLSAYIIFKNKNFVSRNISANQSFIHVHSAIFILQLAFAFYSVGNAEFMVMLPFLLLLVILFYFEIKKSVLWAAALALIIWNFSYGIYPNHKYDFTGSEKIATKVISNRSDFFIIDNMNLIDNIIYYKTGIDTNKNITNAPWERIASNKPLSKLSDTIDYLLSRNIKVFTNSVEKPKVMNRASVLVTKSDDEFFSRYLAVKIDSISAFYGKYYLCEIQLKDK